MTRASGGTVARPAAARRRPGPAWIPRQHGAWAMLAVPTLVGALRSGPAPLHAVLAALLFAGYFLFNAAALAVRSRRWSRHAGPLLTYGALSAVLGAVAAAARPDLWWWVPVYLPLALASLAFSWQRADRALANDGLTILAACLYAGVMAQVGVVPGGPGEAWVVVALFAYFFGTALYVKTVIRERANRGYHAASVGYHLAWTGVWVASAAVGVPIGPVTQLALVGLFAALTARAALMAGRRVRPLTVGLGEIGASTALAVVLLTR